MLSNLIDKINLNIVGLILLLLAIFWGWLSYSPQSFVIDFGPNLSTELGSIALTILIIDSLNRRHAQKEEQIKQLKLKLIQQLGQSNNALALDANKKLLENGWLTDGSLINANLVGAYLKDGLFDNAILDGTNFHASTLKNAYFNMASMKGCLLTNSDLRQISFQAVNLAGSNLTNSNLQQSHFKKINGRGATFDACWLEDTNFEDSDMSAASFINANLKNANFINSRLPKVDFSNANLEGANLQNADLRWATITAEQLSSCASLDGTILPNNL